MHSYATENRTVSSPVGPPAGQERTACIQISMKCLEDEIAHIGSVADRLIARLQPVLRCEPANERAAAMAAAANPPTACQLANCLDERTRTLARVREVLCDMDNRIEL